MNKNKELAINTLILTIGKICTQFISFLLLPLYTTFLSPNEFGIFDLLNTYVALLVPLFNWQFDNGMFRFMINYRNNKDIIKSFFSTVFIVNMGQVVLYLIFYILVQDFLTLDFKLYLALDVSINIILNTLLQFPRGMGDNSTYAFGSFVSATSIVILNVLFIVYFKLGILGMFLSTIIGKILTCIYLIIRMRLMEYFSFRKFKKNVFKEVLKYSLPLVPNQLCWWVIDASDRTIISIFIGIAANGIYSVANKFSGLFVTFYNIFHLSWTESVSLHIKDEDSQEYITGVINSSLSFFASVCFGIIVILPFVFNIFVNENYKASYNQIPILLVAVLFQVIVGLYSVIYTAYKKSVEIMKTSIYSAIINIVTNLIMIKFIGLYAASFSTLIAYMTMAIYRYFHVRKYINIRIEKKLFLLISIMGTVSILSYYLRILIIHIIAFLIIVILAAIINQKLLNNLLVTLKHFFKNIKKRNCK
ncbi:lipopolysaccharide biosynthesis protein [Anaerococcus porci]|nr:oligosaccharide flippase family protein [Anaerococcus porci]